MKKTILIIITVSVVAGLSGGGVYLWQKSVWDKEKMNLTSELNALQKQPSQFQTTEKQNATLDLNCPENYKKYISENLGIGFCYPEAVGEPGDMVVTEEVGDKIFVHYQSMSKERGQFVEVFNKDTNDTLVRAIEKKFLQNISKDKCWASLLTQTSGAVNVLNAFEYPQSYIFANPLQYPVPENPTDFSDALANAGNCPNGYYATNGIRAFMMDQNNPDRFFFLDIGQYYISGTNQPAWQETIKIFQKEAY